jgi:hypothetical protein
MRTVLIRIEGVKPRIHKLQLREGERASDILRYLKAPDGYILARAASPTRPFPQEAEVHALVANGEHLMARSRSAAVVNAATFTLSFSN